MPTAEQLNPPPSPVEGDRSTTDVYEDGSTVTSWPDGTSRTDYPDGTAMIIYPDFAVLNIEPDGTRELNDQYGNPLDPSTGLPLGEITAPAYGFDRILRALEGDERISDVQEAIGLAKEFTDAVLGEIDPTSWAEQVFNAILHVLVALEVEERGCYVRGWCYAAMYGALDLGEPPEPAFAGSLGGPEQDELDREQWHEGVAQARTDLADGPSGVALRNKILFRIAHDGGDPATTLNRTWQAACAASDDDELAKAYAYLSWPEPVGA